GRKLRLDSTVVETDIHHPSDSTLLADGVRVLSRLVRRAKAAVAAGPPAGPSGEIAPGPPSGWRAGSGPQWCTRRRRGSRNGAPCTGGCSPWRGPAIGRPSGSAHSW